MDKVQLACWAALNVTPDYLLSFYSPRKFLV